MIQRSSGRSGTIKIYSMPLPSASRISTLMTKNKLRPKKPIHIIERDKKLLESIREFGLVSTEQVKYLFYPSVGRARKRLRQLWLHGYLQRIDRPTRLGEGTKTKLYRISSKGLKLIDTNADSPKSAPRTKSLSPFYAEHLLSINRFRICLELATKETPGLYLVNWKPDRQSVLKVKLHGEPSGKLVTIIPDATLTLWSGNRSLNYFLEVDRGTATVKRTMTKLLAYEELFLNPKTQTPPLAPGFRVLIVTENQTRSNNILKSIQKLGRKIGRPDIFLVTTDKQFSYKTPESILGPIWSHVEKDETVSSGQTMLPFLRRSRQLQVNHQ